MSMQMAPLELAELLDSENPPHLLDVRELEENQFVALPNSTLIPLGELAARAGEISDWREKNVVVYCHHGIRSLHAIGLLQAMGFTRLRNLSGGIHGWAREVDNSMATY
jgi:rhodanese-related sulfurtransferase